MRSLLSWLAAGLLNLFAGDIKWPVLCPECGEAKRSPRRCRVHMAADRPDVAA